MLPAAHKLPCMYCICIRTIAGCIFIVLLLYLILYTAQPATVTTVAMETCGVSEERRLSTGERKDRERRKRGKQEIDEKEHRRGQESCRERAEEREENEEEIIRGRKRR